MTDHPMPASGGSYIRNADGSLTLIEDSAEAPAAAEPSPAPAAQAGGTRKPKSESDVKGA
jgi:hypothetical protein